MELNGSSHSKDSKYSMALNCLSHVRIFSMKLNGLSILVERMYGMAFNGFSNVSWENYTVDHKLV